MKTCPICFSKFTDNTSAGNKVYCSRKCKSRKHYIIHKNSILKRGKLWAKKNGDKVKNYHLLSRYGITLERKKEILSNQNNKCGICGCTSKGKDLHLDHDHNTKKIRGVLCDKCNRGIGYFMDSVALLENAVKYLREFSNA